MFYIFQFKRFQESFPPIGPSKHLHRLRNFQEILQPVRILGPIWNTRAQGMPTTVQGSTSIYKFPGNFFTDRGSADLLSGEGFSRLYSKATWYRLRDSIAYKTGQHGTALGIPLHIKQRQHGTSLGIPKHIKQRQHGLYS